VSTLQRMLRDLHALRESCAKADLRETFAESRKREKKVLDQAAVLSEFASKVASQAEVRSYLFVARSRSRSRPP